MIRSISFDEEGAGEKREKRGFNSNICSVESSERRDWLERGFPMLQ